MHFTKWNGCGNDFILINALTIKDINPIINECVHLCDRHFGIGADGIIFVLPSLQADLKMKIFNADGTEAEIVVLHNGFLNWDWLSKKKFLSKQVPEFYILKC